MILASEEQDDLAKTFQPPNAGCSVYMYVKVGPYVGYGPDAPNPLPIKVIIDDGPAISLVDSEGFLHWLVDAGRHQIKIVGGDYSQGLRVPKILCLQGDVVFFKYIIRKKDASFWRGWNSTYDTGEEKYILFGLVEESEGRREINKRRLIVMD